MPHYKYQVVGVILALGAACVHATPAQIFRAEGNQPLVVTQNVMSARGTFLSLFNETVQSYGFEGLDPGDVTPLDIDFAGSAGSTIKATLTSSGTTPGGASQTVMATGESGRFNTTPDITPASAARYWRVNASGSGSFSIEFDKAISAFGFYGTDIGDFGGVLSLVLTPFDTTMALETVELRPASAGVASNGLASFFGFADASRTYSKVTFVTAGASGVGFAEDFFGFDDFIVADAGQFLAPTGVPEPGSLTLAGLALLAASLACKRRLRGQ